MLLLLFRSREVGVVTCSLLTFVELFCFSGWCGSLSRASTTASFYHSLKYWRGAASVQVTSVSDMGKHILSTMAYILRDDARCLLGMFWTKENGTGNQYASSLRGNAIWWNITINLQKLVDICWYELQTNLQNFVKKDLTKVKIFQKSFSGLLESDFDEILFHWCIPKYVRSLNNNKQVYKAPCMPTEGCRGAGEVSVRRFCDSN